MNKKITGRCLNIGNCDIANSMAVVEVDESTEFICTECGKPFLLANQPRAAVTSQPRSGWRASGWWVQQQLEFSD